MRMIIGDLPINRTKFRGNRSTISISIPPTVCRSVPELCRRRWSSLPARHKIFTSIRFEPDTDIDHIASLPGRPRDPHLGRLRLAGVRTTRGLRGIAAPGKGMIFAVGRSELRSTDSAGRSGSLRKSVQRDQQALAGIAADPRSTVLQSGRGAHRR